MVGLRDHEFLQWFEGAQCKQSGKDGPGDGRSFIPYPKIEEYFRDNSRVRRLLKTAFEDVDPLPVGVEEIRNNYSKVFSILLSIGRGSYIACFVRRPSLSDQHLPFSSSTTYFPHTPTDPELFANFNAQQWSLCAPMFDCSMNIDFEESTILPIVRKEELASGGSATTHKIILHPAYDKLCSKNGPEPVGDHLNNHTRIRLI